MEDWGQRQHPRAQAMELPEGPHGVRPHPRGRASPCSRARKNHGVGGREASTRRGSTSQAQGSSAGWQAPIRAGAWVKHAKCRSCLERWGKFEPWSASRPRHRCVPSDAGHAKQSGARLVGPREPTMGDHPARTMATELERMDGGAVGLRAQCKLDGGHAGTR